ncbi:MAG: hypothetical protein QM754_02210 [Tepidisphaeraceae bacterium]
MHISLDDFCPIVAALDRSNAEKALAILWYMDYQQPDTAMTPGRLAKTMGDHHVGTPNPTALGKMIRETKLANETKAGFVLKPGSRRIVREWLPADFDGIQPMMDHASGFLSDAIWRGTTPYLEGVCLQLNGCHRACFYDAASVMLRRVIETLIIEAYEVNHRRAQVEDGSGNPHMLGKLVDLATASASPNGVGLTLGREAKRGLHEIKKLGDRSAHNRRVLANRADMENVRSGARTAVEELLVIAGLKRMMSKSA